MNVVIVDELLNGTIINNFELEIQSNGITARDLIQMRVVHEVEKYNNEKSDYYLGLVKPSEAETTLNGYKLKDKKYVDAEEQVYIALDAFNKNGYFMLVNDIQIENLDQIIYLNSHSKVSFIKLTPLVGG